MRGRSLLKEPSSSSICAFCAHRLGAARRPSHVQRRFLQSSRSAGKPPAAGAALREEDDFAPQPRNAGPSWGLPGGSSSSANWKLASQGRSTDASTWPSWGQPSPISNQKEGLPRQSNDSNSSRRDEDLLPHELRARELLVQSQRRQVLIPTGPGPESSRAGRPIPFDEPNKAERLAIARSAVEKKKAQDLEVQRMAAAQGGPPLIRRLFDSKAILGDTELQPPVAASTEDLKNSPRWTQLRRRGEDVTTPPQRSHGDPFAEARARREEETKSGRYTPLGLKPISRPERNTPQQKISRLNTEFHSQGEQPTPPKNDRIRNSESPELKDGPRMGGSTRNSIPSDGSTSSNPQPGFKIRRFVSMGGPSEAPNSSLKASRTKDGNISDIDGHSGSLSHRSIRRLPSDEVPAYEAQERPERNDRPREKREAISGEDHEELRFMERERASRKPPARFAAAKPSYDDMPRGRGRDKAKRRQQFVEQNEDLEDDIEEARRRAELKKQRKKEKEAKRAAAPVPILLPEYISVSNLAMALRVRVEAFIEKMEELGYEEMGTDHILNAEDSGLIASEYNYEAIIDRSESEDLKAREPAQDPSSLPQRPPVVTIMGHVDHGKTTLLDWLRKSSVAATEHGGITQHIGAFSVPMPSGKIITFLDTPGHAAFLNMRQRGANVTDIVILVVAADDSVKPQTVEAINHAKNAKVPIIVAINKIDKEEANIERVKQDLARHGVDVEDFGGDTQVVCVSGKTGKGMDKLEEAAVTLSEIIDMRAEKDGQAEGWVLEASVKSMGKVATVLVRRGTMRPGDFIVAGKTWARIRCLRNEAGVEIQSAGPGTPVEIDGWREQPEAGDEVLQAPDESKAKSVVDYRLEKEERDKMAEDMEAINESRKAEQQKKEREKEEARLAAEAEEADQDYTPESADTSLKGPKEVYFIIKGDVSGSVEAVKDSISVLGNKEVQPHILRYGVGHISEFDIEHAAAAKGTLINFNTPLDPHISQLAEKSKVSIIDHNIIYRLVDDVRAELSKYLPPLITQRVLGEAEIAQIFEITVKGRQQKNIAGCKIRNGTVSRNAKVRVLRNNEKVFDGSLASLKNGKRDVQETKKGTECGLGFENWFEFHVGDLIQAYEEKEEKRYL